MDGDPDDIQAQVLQTTLAEIETSRQQQHLADLADGPADPLDPEAPVSATAAAAPLADPLESPECCVICLDSVSDPCAALPCGHAHFDFLCIVSWLQEHPNCPLCKANVYKVRYPDPQKENTDAFYRVPNAPRARDTAPRDEERQTIHKSHTNLNSTSPRSALQSRLLRGTSRRCPRPPPSADEAIQRRRHIYRHQLYSLRRHPSTLPPMSTPKAPTNRPQDIGSNRISQYRQPPTPVQFSSTPHLVSRARLWIRRELQVFSFLSDPTPAPEPTTTSAAHDSLLLLRRRNNAEFLLEYVVAVLKTVDLQGSAGQAEAMLADFLGRAHARLFLHELRGWLRSPAQSLAAWDREVQYPEPEAGAGHEHDPEVERETEVGPGASRSGNGSRVVSGSGEGERSWRDRGGDHWRAGPSPGERGKRKRREGDGAGEGRASRPKRERGAG